MRHHLKPHKFPSYVKELKVPMPPQKIVKKLEKLKEKGLEVEYPRAPWYNDNVDKIIDEQKQKEKRISEAQHAELLPVYPADRSKGVGSGKIKRQRTPLPKKVKFNI